MTGAVAGGQAARTDGGVPPHVARALAGPLLAVPVLDPAILDDLDTPADLASLRRRLAAEI